jgi:hypothetical protein
MIMWSFEQIEHDRYLSLVFQPAKASAFTAGVTSDVAISFGRSMLRRFDVDRDATGFRDGKLDELVEADSCGSGSGLRSPRTPPHPHETRPVDLNYG